MKLPRLMARWWRSGTTRASAAAVRLFADGSGALARYPGPAILLRREGENGYRVLANNQPGAIIANAFAEGRAPLLTHLVESSMAYDDATVETMDLPQVMGGSRLELTILPLGDGGSALILGRDVQLEHNLRATLVESRQRYKDLVEASSAFAWETGDDGTFVFVSSGGALGYSANELVGRDPGKFIVDAPGAEATNPFFASEPVTEAEIWFRRIDGMPACLLMSSVPFKGDNGRLIGVRGVCRDITEARERDDALTQARNRERLLAYIVRTIRDEVDPLDMLNAAASATARATSAKGCRIYRCYGDKGFDAAAEYGALPVTLSEDDIINQAKGRAEPFTLDTKGGHLLVVATRHHEGVNGVIVLWWPQEGEPWSDGDHHDLFAEVANQLGIAIEQIANHEQLQKFSRTDSMTGLLNRRTFKAELDRHYQRISRSGTPAALLCCDLDNFKMVNDVHGHQRGDEALMCLAEILIGNTRASDLVARLGGDEFALWFEDMDAAAAETKVRNLLASGNSKLVEFSGNSDNPLGMSIGLALVDPEGREPLEELMARADEAMYEAKHGGKGQYSIAPPAAPGAGTDRKALMP